MTGPRLTPLVASLPATVPFVGPETQERARGAAFRARLGANESVFGSSPAAVEAMAAAAAEAWKYGDAQNFELRAALSRHHGFPMEGITVGEGIDGLLGVLVRLLVCEGRAVVTSDGTYPTFNYHVAGFGGALHKVAYREDVPDLAGLAAAARETEAVLVYLANPDNPMGGWHRAKAVRDLIAALPEDCVLCLDEAYADFAPEDAVPAFDPADARVIRMRTFSKAHGLAGARVGYALGQVELVAAFERVRNHFGVTRMGQAGALAALGDPDWLRNVVAQVETARTRLGRIACDNGLVPLPSATNFVTIDCRRDGAFARRVVTELGALGVFVRMPFVAPQDRCIRISAGSDADLDIVAEALPMALSRAAEQG